MRLYVSLFSVPSSSFKDIGGGFCLVNRGGGGCLGGMFEKPWKDAR